MLVGGRSLVVLSYPTPRDASQARGPEELTFAERDVLALVLRGHRNAEIAATRGTSLGTVSKQIDSIYRKLGVHSRGELAARPTGRKRASDPD
jgi:DNA-binding NarL/FixJ family response regulator